MADKLRESALEYHRLPTPGKLAIVATKPLANQRDLALAYSPGRGRGLRGDRRGSRPGGPAHGAGAISWVSSPMAPPCSAWGPSARLAAKPVMEGKAVLFKTFAGIDVFDIEIAEQDPAKLVDIIASLEPHLRRHQPRGYQGAGMFRGGTRLARAHAHSRIP